MGNDFLRNNMYGTEIDPISPLTKRMGEVDGVLNDHATQLAEKAQQSDVVDIITLKPNGTDDTANLKACNGKTVALASGTFQISSPITWNKNTNIRGAGIGTTIIQLKSGSNCNMIAMENANYSSLKDLTIDGNNGSNSADPLDPKSSLLTIRVKTGYSLSSYGAQYQNLYVINGANNGVHIQGKDVTNGWDWNWVLHVDNVYAMWHKGYSWLDESTDNLFSNLNLSAGNKADMMLSGASSSMYSNLKLDGQGGTTNSGQTSTTDGANAILNNVTNVRFNNLDIQSAQYVGMKVFNSSELYITGDINNCGIAYNPSTDVNRGIGIYLSNSSKKIEGHLAFFNTSGNYQNRDVIIDSSCSDIFISTPDRDSISVTNSSTTCVVESLSKLFSSNVNNTISVPFSAVPNLITNGTFESGTTSWNIGNATLDTTSKIDGVNSMLFSNDGTKLCQVNKIISGLTGGHIYGVAFKGLISSYTSGSNALYISTADSTGTIGYTLTSDISAYADTTIIGSTQVVVALAQVPVGSTSMSVRIYSSNAVITTYIDDIVLVDLTALYGAGSEPKASQWKTLISSADMTQTAIPMTVNYNMRNYQTLLQQIVNKLSF